MGLLVNLFKLIPPTFKIGFCPKDMQQLANELIGGTQLTFLIQQGNFLYNYGSTTPSPENRIFPWLYTPNGRWYTFQGGLWIAPMDPSQREPDFRRMWKPATGTAESALWSVDEGDGTDPSTVSPTLTTGASWQVDHDMDGVFPIGVGAIPTSNPAASVVLGDTGGEAQHTLTAAEGAVADHIHPFGKSNNAAGLNGDDAYFRQLAMTTVANYTGTYITGSDGVHQDPLTQSDLYTLPSGMDGAGVMTPAAFKLLPPYRAIYWVKPTSRRYYTLPA